MYEILNVLVRLMAPVLSFTAEEIWQYMPGEHPSPTVHSELFVEVKDQYIDPELSSAWETIIAVRKEVARALEIARKEKKIGHSLDAAVTLLLPSDLYSVLEPYQDQLRSIFIVSSVELVRQGVLEGAVPSEAIPGLGIGVNPSEAPKCERCWVHDSSVGSRADHPTICNRCFGALTEMESIDH
jgi:isoleucyl-tRNA synthetase